MLDGGISLEQAISDTKLATRQYIRRQETWFRRDQRISWLDSNSDRINLIEKAILNA
jgi:tRNA dimethylallyltransferase